MRCKITHLSLFSMCKSTDPSQSVMVSVNLCSSYSGCCTSPQKHTNTHKHNHTGCRVKYQKVSRKMRGETGVIVRQTRAKLFVPQCLSVKLRTQLEIINKLQCLAMHILFARCALQFLCFTKLWSTVIKMGKYIFVRVYFIIANHLTI